MKKYQIQLAILLGCALPYGFLAMYGDVAHRTMGLYLPWIIGIGLLCLAAVRTRNIPVLLLGNGGSFLISWALLRCFGAENWGYYFKPFTPFGLLTALSVVALLIQGLLMVLLRRKISCKRN